MGNKNGGVGKEVVKQNTQIARQAVTGSEKATAQQHTDPIHRIVTAKLECSLQREGREFVKEEYVAIAMHMNHDPSQIPALLQMSVPELRQSIRAAMVVKTSNSMRTHHQQLTAPLPSAPPDSGDISNPDTSSALVPY